MQIASRPRQLAPTVWKKQLAHMGVVSLQFLASWRGRLGIWRPKGVLAA